MQIIGTIILLFPNELVGVGCCPSATASTTDENLAEVS